MEGKVWRPGPTVCRCCLSEGCYKDISTEYFWMGKKEVYADMLSDTFDLSIQYAPTGGPNSQSRLICEPCISRLRDATDFRRQIKECEQTFMEYLNPSTTVDIEIPVELPEKEHKIVSVKVEKPLSDDDDFGDTELLDDDDLDDEPLMNLASKVPKKESVDVTDLIDNAKAEKRKSTTKAKAAPKKAKVKEAKPSVSKAKPEKKKKDQSSLNTAKKNAEIIVKHSTAYPFRLPEDKVMCIFCCEEFAKPSQFRNHMDEEHSYSSDMNMVSTFSHKYEGYIKADCSVLRCRLCEASFERIVEVAQHLIKEHNGKLDSLDVGIQPFKFANDRLLCGICDQNFPCLRQLSKHTASHFQNYTCEACGKSYTTQSVLKQHIRFTHSGGCVCRRCRQTFPTPEARRQHVVKNVNCWPYVCMYCATTRFLRYSEREEHLVKEHGKGERTHRCPECGDSFSSRSKYRDHFTTNHSEFCFVCSYCGKKFSCRRYLDEHLVSHTGVKQFECGVCLKTFPRKANLSQHMWIHNENKRFECTQCNKKFNQRVSYRSHMKTHHSDVKK
ncbi:zinc finger protein 77 isoform X11 [Pieris rapae]|uniref:zinc finger protein 77 isoform X11 n=1 Tax=Pieris rapae TaxID=64459 RepID=UPI001E27F908|nr:zinc finger protein 77 isoform X11 [Pieris rapae]